MTGKGVSPNPDAPGLTRRLDVQRTASRGPGSGAGAWQRDQ